MSPAPETKSSIVRVITSASRRSRICSRRESGPSAIGPDAKRIDGWLVLTGSWSEPMGSNFTAFAGISAGNRGSVGPLRHNRIHLADTGLCSYA
jgi:hypothetical protein